VILRSATESQARRGKPTQDCTGRPLVLPASPPDDPLVTTVWVGFRKTPPAIGRAPTPTSRAPGSPHRFCSGTINIVDRTGGDARGFFCRFRCRRDAVVDDGAPWDTAAGDRHPRDAFQGPGPVPGAVGSSIGMGIFMAQREHVGPTVRRGGSRPPRWCMADGVDKSTMGTGLVL